MDVKLQTYFRAFCPMSMFKSAKSVCPFYLVLKINKLRRFSIFNNPLSYESYNVVTFKYFVEYNVTPKSQIS